MGYSPWGCKELGMIEHACAHTHTHTHTVYLEVEIPKEQYLVEKTVHKQLWPNDDLISLFDFFCHASF